MEHDLTCEPNTSGNHSVIDHDLQKEVFRGSVDDCERYMEGYYSEWARTAQTVNKPSTFYGA